MTAPVETPFFYALCGTHTVKLSTVRLQKGELLGKITIEPDGATLVGSGSILNILRALRKLQLALERDAIAREAEGGEKP